MNPTCVRSLVTLLITSILCQIVDCFTDEFPPVSNIVDYFTDEFPHVADRWLLY